MDPFVFTFSSSNKKCLQYLSLKRIPYAKSINIPTLMLMWLVGLWSYQEGKPLCWQKTKVRSFRLDIYDTKLHTGPLNGCGYEEGTLLFSLSSSIPFTKK